MTFFEKSLKPTTPRRHWTRPPLSAGAAAQGVLTGLLLPELN